MLNLIKRDLDTHKDPDKAVFLLRFFKTGKGQYGENDVFLGITVPMQRTVSKKYKDTPFSDLKVLLKSKIHEYRLTALLILVEQYKKADQKAKEKIFRFYLDNRSGVNNWDLVDLSAPNIVGEYLLDKDKEDFIWRKFSSRLPCRPFHPSRLTFLLLGLSLSSQEDL